MDESQQNVDQKVSESVFEPISGDDTGLTEISSVCVNCEEQVSCLCNYNHIMWQLVNDIYAISGYNKTTFRSNSILSGSYY